MIEQNYICDLSLYVLKSVGSESAEVKVNEKIEIIIIINRD